MVRFRYLCNQSEKTNKPSKKVDDVEKQRNRAKRARVGCRGVCNVELEMIGDVVKATIRLTHCVRHDTTTKVRGSALK